ncbi:FAD/NAD(P)-binding protein [Chromohalobacter nigrandesensis]|uniref:FAD/NAD(P)-binding protein n=1 Tax=Chromohalobacter nigrandesensis TaxID=119863 RepID=UPI001FF6D8F6|nr:FAD/NAD(P)-binding protein [Chromohalobacter nigrandesensis]MCK0745395.1 FAD/NAD(P)-binding protein [Chromohalobacter nigrandesensis]
MHDVAIVGFGATGVSFLRQLHSHLYEQDLDPIRVALVSPEESFSSGLAFGQAEYFHKVNTPPELMGIDPEDPQGFATWMRQQRGQEDPYPPRVTYSDYLKYIYRTLAGDKLAITEFHTHASDIDTHTAYQVIRLNDGREVMTRRTVLALGSVSAPTFNTASGMNPVQPREIAYTRAPECALVAGTGLTAVDCVRSLARLGTQSIHMFSRSGFAPTVISKGVSYHPEHFIWDKLKAELSRHPRETRLPSVIKLLKAEIKQMPNPEVPRANRFLLKGNLKSYWGYLLSRADNADLPFQDTLGSTRFYAHKIWRKLGERERQDFQRSFGSFWACWRHPIPADIVRELQQYAKEGRLHLHRPVAPIKRQRGQYILETKDTRILANILIDGTGGSGDMQQVSSPLVRNLLNKQLAIAHPCGGLRVDSLTYGLENDTRSTGIYCLGPLAKGVLFSTNAFWFNAQCASQLAYYLAIEIRLEPHGEVVT